MLEKMWRPLLDWLLVSLAVASLLLYHLLKLLPHPSASETVSKLAASNLHTIESNPFFLPYKLLQYVLISTGHDSVLYMRLVSVFFAAIAVGFMYFVLRHWHTARIALMGMFLFVSSSWFLTYARTATPTIMYVSIVAILAYGAWARKSVKTTTILLSGASLAAYLLYIPGFIWFVGGAAIWQRKHLGMYVRRTTKAVPLAIIMFVVLISPLVLALFQHPELIKLLLGLPTTITLRLPLDFVKNALGNLNQLVLHGPVNGASGVVGVALLDVFVLLMLILGSYSYIFRRKLDRAKILGGLLVVSFALASLGGAVNLIILLPMLYVIAAAGIAFLLLQWLTVFPRNPLARSIGVTLVVLLVATTSFYHIKRYFIVWPHTVEARQAFQARSIQ